MQDYAAPKVIDLGSLEKITQAAGLVGEEDGGSKLLIHHVSGGLLP
jgi:hypothetical protein